MSDLERRIEELEAIVREQNHTISDMYEDDMEATWSKKADELQDAYEQKYGADLGYHDE